MVGAMVKGSALRLQPKYNGQPLTGWSRGDTWPGLWFLEVPLAAMWQRGTHTHMQSGCPQSTQHLGDA